MRAGVRFHCRMRGGELVFRPEGGGGVGARPRLFLEKKTGIWITQAPPGAPVVTSEQVRAAMEDFP